jgi:PAS domain-containing protein
MSLRRIMPTKKLIFKALSGLLKQQADKKYSGNRHSIMRAAQNSENSARAADSIANQFKETPASALSGSSGLMMLDSQGHICSCSEGLAALAGVTPVELVGQAVKTLLPAMPVSGNTPGYNVAFAAFHGASGRVYLSRLIKSDGSSIAVSVLLNVLRANREYRFTLEVRELPRELADQRDLPPTSKSGTVQLRDKATFLRCA